MKGQLDFKSYGVIDSLKMSRRAHKIEGGFTLRPTPGNTEHGLICSHDATGETINFAGFPFSGFLPSSSHTHGQFLIVFQLSPYTHRSETDEWIEKVVQYLYNNLVRL